MNQIHPGSSETNQIHSGNYWWDPALRPSTKTLSKIQTLTQLRHMALSQAQILTQLHPREDPKPNPSPPTKFQDYYLSCWTLLNSRVCFSFGSPSTNPNIWRRNNRLLLMIIYHISSHQGFCLNLTEMINHPLAFDGATANLSPELRPSPSRQRSTTHD